MAKFLFVYRGGECIREDLSPEAQQEAKQVGLAWIRRAVEQRWMISPGDALLPEGRTITRGVVTDGPFVESKEIVGGYSLVEAESLDAAAKLAKDCPVFRNGGSIEIRPLAGLTDNC
jgi:hypothetical protein